MGLLFYINDNNQLPAVKYIYLTAIMHSNVKPTMTKITFQTNGAPYSSQFDDIYFDTDDGFQQSDMVFVKGNLVYSRLCELEDNIIQQVISTKENKFTIGETGFGSGLNFLLTLIAYQKYLNHSKQADKVKLNFISVEKYPLSKVELERSLAVFPELSTLSSMLVEQYPEQMTQDISLSFFDGLVKLTLLFGDATERLTQLSTESINVDAWYLDGFSPAKNPDMWQPELYQAMARISKLQATVATFTIAGKVRRELSDAGFRLTKQNTTGNKKAEMLFGRLQQSRLNKHGYKIRPKIAKPQQVSIIGGGVAAACAAYALTQNGVKVTLYCKDEKVAQGASSNAIGALFPLLHQQRDEISCFYEKAFIHARKTFDQLLADGFDFEHDWCGLLEVSYKDSLIKRQQQFEQNNAWPTTLIHGVNKQQANEISQLPLDMEGLFMPNAGWIRPPSLVNALFDAANATGRLRVHTQKTIKSIKQLENKSWQLSTHNDSFSTDILIFCGGAEGIKLDYIDQLPLSSVRGQVSNVNATEQTSKLSTVICHKGYLTPQNKGIHCIGATFQKNSFDVIAKPEEDEFNLNMLHQCLPGLTHWKMDDIRASKARLRCMIPDHLPMVGAFPNIKAHVQAYPHLRKDKNWNYDTAAPCIDNLYVLTGLGARGLVSAPLLADILVADICGTPYPVDDEQLFNLSPNRFVIRDLIKRKIGE